MEVSDVRQSVEKNENHMFPNKSNLGYETYA